MDITINSADLISVTFARDDITLYDVVQSDTLTNSKNAETTGDSFNSRVCHLNGTDIIYGSQTLNVDCDSNNDGIDDILAASLTLS